MTFARRAAPPIDPATREAFDRAAPPRTPQRFAPSTHERAADRVLSEHQAQPSNASAEDIRARARAHEAQHPARPSSAAAPDPGRILARIPRPDGTELRVSLHHWQGDPSNPYVRVAPWQSSAPDAWPVKGKGVTVKVRERQPQRGRPLTPLSRRCDRCGAPHGRVTCARCMVRDLGAFWCVLLGALAFVALVTAYGDRATWSEPAAPSAPRCSP